MSSTAESGDGIIAGAETIDLQGANSNGVLLLHGFGDTPQTLGLLADHLHGAGFGVRAPVLPGHGRSVEAFTRSRRVEWLDFARQELVGLRRRYPSVAILGLSMGGAIASLLAAENSDLRTLVLVAPYLGMRLSYRVISAVSWIWGPFAGTVKSNSPRSIHDPAERAKNLGYGVYNGRLLYELWRLTYQARRALPLIHIPTLLIQSREDPRIALSIAERSFELLGTADKRLVLTVGAGHIITVDNGRERVFQAVREWLETHMQAEVATA
jgi:carboxylesterase